MTNDMVSAAYAQGRRDQREADTALMRQALEALEQCGFDDTRRNYGMESHAITSLCAAQATGDNLSPTEPVAYSVGRTLHWHTGRGIDDAQLYAAPPQRKPLTDEEMRECAQAMDAEPLAEGWPELIKFARAIERAHGIGGSK